MSLDGLRTYVQLANGLGDLTRERAVSVARGLLGQTGVDQVLAGAMRDQVGGVAEDLLATGRANRDILIGLVRAEVSRNISALGLAGQEEVATLRVHVERLERRLRELEARVAATSSHPGQPQTVVAPRRQAVRRAEGGASTAEAPAPTSGRTSARRPAGTGNTRAAAGNTRAAAPTPRTPPRRAAGKRTSASGAGSSGRST
ncbi:MAG: hypothetical protein ACYCU5_13270, partial [Actinomycetes bacterium]